MAAAEQKAAETRKKKKQKSRNPSRLLQLTRNGLRPAGRGFRLIRGDADGVLFGTVLSLLVIGVLMMFSASFPAALEIGQSGTFYAARQSLFALVGLVFMCLLSVLDYHIFEKLWISGTAFVLAVALLIAVVIPGVGYTANGATRWLAIGSDSAVTFQPSEFMKIAIVLFFSMLIVRNRNRMEKFWYGIFPFVAMLALVDILMYMEPHLSGMIIISLLAVTLVFIGGASPGKLAVTGAVCAVVGVIAIIVMVRLKGFDYIQVRIIAWLHPFEEEYMRKETWQTSQTLIAIGSGGMFGRGLGGSRQKFGYLPEAQNDLVFAVLCEEFGFVGAVTVILLFCLLIFRGFYIAAKAKDKLGMLIAVGFTMHIGVQALLNIAVVTNTIPNTGISLPFFSYGGTALLMQLCEMGVLLNISRSAKLD